MSDQKNNKKDIPAEAPAETQENKKTVSLQTIYIKDISFEAPNSPDVFLEKEVTPDTKLNIANTHTKLGDGIYDDVCSSTRDVRNSREAWQRLDCWKCTRGRIADELVDCG